MYEEKIDGWRMLALKDAGRVRLVSRNARDHTKQFPEIVQALTKLKPKTFTLDGEIAVFDGHLISRFEWIRPAPRRSRNTTTLHGVRSLTDWGEGLPTGAAEGQEEGA